MSNPWRLSLAERIGRTYLAEPSVEAVLIGGSTGRGHADRFSDIEMGVFWGDFPTVDTRQKLIDTAGGVDSRVFPDHFTLEDAYYDDFFIGRASDDRPSSGVLIEIVHKTIEGSDRQLTQLIDDHQPDDYLINLAAALAYGQPVGQSDRLAAWHARLIPYPDELKTAVIKKEAQIDHFWRSQMLLERNHNLIALYQLWTNVAAKLLKTLAALNGVYFWGEKWAANMAQSIEVQPQNFYARLVEVFQIDPFTGYEILNRLVVETYDCIDRLWPAVSTQRLREIFHYQRESWTTSPVGL